MPAVNGPNMKTVSPKTMMQLSQFDPPKYGWSISGGMVDLLPPHERARRREGKRLAKSKERNEVTNTRSLDQNEPARSRPGQRNPPLSTEIENSSSPNPPPVDQNKKHIGSRHIANDQTRVEVKAVPMEVDTKSNDATAAVTVEKGEASVANSLITAGKSSEVPASTAGIVVGAGSHVICSEKEEKKQEERPTPVVTSEDHLHSTLKQKSSSSAQEQRETKKAIDKNLLNIYKYHRGKAGSEERDSQTYELLHDIEPQDTNHDWDPKTMVTRIKVTFPLNDDDNDDDDGGSDGSRYSNHQEEQSQKDDSTIDSKVSGKQQEIETDSNQQEPPTKRMRTSSPLSSTADPTKVSKSCDLVTVEVTREENQSVLNVNMQSNNEPQAQTVEGCESHGVASNGSLELNQRIDQQGDKATAKSVPAEESHEHNKSKENQVSLKQVSSSSKSSKLPKSDTRYYFREEVRWNLADPSMPTPEVYAMNIATEFGLSWRTTLDLEASIQHQLQKFIKSLIYMPCITLNDAAGKKRDLSSLHAEAEKERSKDTNTLQDSKVIPSAHAVGGKKGAFETVAFDPEVDKTYLKEVKKRLKRSSASRVMSIFKDKPLSEQGVLVVPTIQKVENQTCHVCRVVKAKCVRFACEVGSHIFCEFHCSNRLGFSILGDDLRPSRARPALSLPVASTPLQNITPQSKLGAMPCTQDHINQTPALPMQQVNENVSLEPFVSINSKGDSSKSMGEPIISHSSVATLIPAISSKPVESDTVSIATTSITSSAAVRSVVTSEIAKSVEDKISSLSAAPLSIMPVPTNNAVSFIDPSPTSKDLVSINPVSAMSVDARNIMSAAVNVTGKHLNSVAATSQTPIATDAIMNASAKYTCSATTPVTAGALVPTINTKPKSSRKQKTWDKKSQSCLDYFSACCPVCALICTCMKCSRRLEKIAREFKSRCLDHTSRFPEDEDNVFKKVKIDVWSLAVGPNECGGSRETFTTKRRRSTDLEKPLQQPRRENASARLPQRERTLKELMSGVTLTVVPKIDLGLIPHEVPFGWSQQNYKPEAEKDVKSDGNVDYCLKCLLGGDLICCDKCPRSFHRACLEKDGEKVDLDESTKEQWHCALCKRDYDESNDASNASLVVIGDAYMDNMAKAFETLVSEATFNDKKVRTLAKICEMVGYLIGYDFGHVFKDPVDMPDYKKIIDRPMDLGTIQSNLLGGKYAELAIAASSSRKGIKPQEKLLKSTIPAPNVTNMTEALPTSVPKKESSTPADKVSVDISTSSLWDTAISLVMKDIEQIWQNCKIYNLDGSAVSRMADVQQLQYRRMRRISIDSDLSSTVIQSVQDVVDAANKNRARIRAVSTVLPYAKRLPSYIKVASNEAMTPKPGEPFVERLSAKPPATKHASKSLIVVDPTTNTIVRHYTTQKMGMLSITKLSDDGFQPGFSPNTEHFIRKIFKASAMDPNLTIFGYRWLIYDDVLARSCIFPGFQDKMEKDEPASNSSGAPLSSSKPKSSTQRKSETGVFVVKEDGASGAHLATFESISAAYVDWLETLQCCLVTPKMKLEDGKKEDMVLFQSQYLNGGAHIDGLQWKLLPYSEKSRLCKSTDKLTRSNSKQGSSTKKRQGNRKQSEPRVIPPATDEHCHAFMLRPKQYCKRKIVNGGNYCLIHMKQMLQGNVANGVKLVSELKGVLPPPRKRSKRQRTDSESGSCLKEGDSKQQAQAQSNVTTLIVDTELKNIGREGVGPSFVSSERAVATTVPVAKSIPHTPAASTSESAPGIRTSANNSTLETAAKQAISMLSKFAGTDTTTTPQTLLPVANPSTSAGMRLSTNSAFAVVGLSPATTHAVTKASAIVAVPSSSPVAATKAMESDAEKIAAVRSMLALSNLKKVAISPVTTSRPQAIPPSAAQGANTIGMSAPVPRKAAIQGEGTQQKQGYIAATGSNVASFIFSESFHSVQKNANPQGVLTPVAPTALTTFGERVQVKNEPSTIGFERVKRLVEGQPKLENQAGAPSAQAKSDATRDQRETHTTATPESQYLALAAVMKFTSPSKRKELAAGASLSDHAKRNRRKIGVLGISLKKQEIIGRWDSIRACSRAVNIPNLKVGNMIKDLEPDENGNVYVAEFDNEEEVLRKIQNAVKAGNLSLEE